MRAKNNSFAGRLWPAGLEFDTCGLQHLLIRLIKIRTRLKKTNKQTKNSQFVRSKHHCKAKDESAFPDRFFFSLYLKKTKQNTQTVI